MKRELFCLIIFQMVLAACSSSNKISKSAGSPADASTTHTAKNSLDWSGSYSGTLPCASCEGIETELQLKEDMTFT